MQHVIVASHLLVAGGILNVRLFVGQLFEHASEEQVQARVIVD